MIDDTAIQALIADDELPTRVRFGRGARALVGTVAARYGSRTLVVSGSSFRSNPAAVSILDHLADAGVTVVDHLVSTGEPDEVGVLALVARLDVLTPDSIVAVGGGSPLDLAKAAAQRPTPARLAELLGGDRTETPGLPVIALPTTAGSGAEVSFAAIILDRAAGRKRGVRGRGVAAREAIIDPELMVGAPAPVAALAGFDAIAHAVETAASRAATDAVIARAGVALPLLLTAVPDVVARGTYGADSAWSDSAWSDAALAAMLMGVNLARSTTCLPHRLQYPVGARTGTPHAAGVAALFPAWLARTVESAPAALARLDRAAGFSDAGTSDEAAATDLAARVIHHLETTGMHRSLRDLGVAEEDLDDLVAAVEGSVANDPGPSTLDDLRALYAASL